MALYHGIGCCVWSKPSPARGIGYSLQCPFNDCCRHNVAPVSVDREGHTNHRRRRSRVISEGSILSLPIHHSRHWLLAFILLVSAPLPPPPLPPPRSMPRRPPRHPPSSIHPPFPSLGHCNVVSDGSHRFRFDRRLYLCRDRHHADPTSVDRERISAFE